MTMTKVITAATLAATVSISAMADSDHKPAAPMQKSSSSMPMSGQMPMMQGQQGGMPMMQGQQGSMPMMKMMQERHAMMQAHMTKMETHMTNVEALLKQLVELQKK